MTAAVVPLHGGDEFSQRVAAILRGYLAEERIKNRELARRINQTDFWVGRRVNGQTPMTIGELATIAEALGQPIGRFLPEGSAYGSEGWEFESLRAHPYRSRRKRRRHMSVVPLYLVADEAATA